jgi:hypothetical protein
MQSFGDDTTVTSAVILSDEEGFVGESDLGEVYSGQK